MDTQLKKGLLEGVVLSAISKGDSYGYKIIQDIEHIIEISESTLYPVLKRMEISSYVETYSVEHNSRLRKYYKITQQGMQRLIDFREELKLVEKVFKYIIEE